jgi:hypothetical protein
MTVNQMFEKMRQDLKNGKVNEEFDKMVDKFVGILNEAIEKYKAETKFWKRQAYILKSKLCRDCNEKADQTKLDLYFENGGSVCLTCPDPVNKEEENCE